ISAYVWPVEAVGARHGWGLLFRMVAVIAPLFFLPFLRLFRSPLGFSRFRRVHLLYRRRRILKLDCRLDKRTDTKRDKAADDKPQRPEDGDVERDPAEEQDQKAAA